MVRRPGVARRGPLGLRGQAPRVLRGAGARFSVTPHRRIGTITWLDSGGTVQHDWHKDEMTGYCLCEGSKTFTEPPWFGGGFYRRTAAGDATAALAFDLPARSFYSVVLSSTGTTLEAPCRGETCGGIGGRTLMQFHAGRFPDVPPEVGCRPEVRDLESGALRGRYTKAVGPATLEVAWSICPRRCTLPAAAGGHRRRHGASPNQGVRPLRPVGPAGGAARHLPRAAGRSSRRAGAGARRGITTPR